MRNAANTQFFSMVGAETSDEDSDEEEPTPEQARYLEWLDEQHEEFAEKTRRCEERAEQLLEENRQRERQRQQELRGTRPTLGGGT